ncbi:uncharacterized protein NP_0804A [Natronomonas pharaonis DSM 2160]|uniref:Helix-hairpin-helix domain-containing protein n=1 Tax=Natronomonas pharaonis (strain ATCC 35678 / DSM 2160 / CIP 103997 / JCM 8858 / NBRC 14720 / NCIMB 2260 / Gabara) TaxID=348780 RepID=A0A1U7EU59_NATPD|nr:helix-hairpin-helix domain-containing protein [Natronomonas pharaonis]CAI48493.1 uncharacterized protein NP_0804A [Natronomonas pharaonis DSM 2160]
MGVFKLLRTVFGLGRSEGTSGTEVSVEHEPEGGDDTDELSEADEDTDGASDADDAVAAETDAAASTGSMAEEPTSDPETAAEPAEAGAGVSDHSGTDTVAAESAEAAGPVPDEPEGGDEPVENVNGIGPAYAKRLSDAGIETVTQLLDADPEAVADETDLSAKRISGWQENAEER